MDCGGKEPSSNETDRGGDLVFDGEFIRRCRTACIVGTGRKVPIVNSGIGVSDGEVVGQFELHTKRSVERF